MAEDDKRPKAPKAKTKQENSRRKGKFFKRKYECIRCAIMKSDYKYNRAFTRFFTEEEIKKHLEVSA